MQGLLFRQLCGSQPTSAQANTQPALQPTSRSYSQPRGTLNTSCSSIKVQLLGEKRFAQEQQLDSLELSISKVGNRPTHASVKILRESKEQLEFNATDVSILLDKVIKEND